MFILRKSADCMSRMTLRVEEIQLRAGSCREDTRPSASWEPNNRSFHGW